MNLSPVYHNSRPDGELLPQEAAAFDLLDRLGIEYDRVSHDAAFNMELCWMSACARTCFCATGRKPSSICCA